MATKRAQFFTYLKNQSKSQSIFGYAPEADSIKPTITVDTSCNKIKGFGQNFKKINGKLCILELC